MKYVKAKKSRQSWSGPFRAKSKPSKKKAAEPVVSEDDNQETEDEAHVG